MSRRKYLYKMRQQHTRDIISVLVSEFTFTLSIVTKLQFCLRFLISILHFIRSLTKINTPINIIFNLVSNNLIDISLETHQNKCIYHRNISSHRKKLLLSSYTQFSKFQITINVRRVGNFIQSSSFTS